MDIGGALVAETGIINNTNFTGNIGNDGGAVYLSRDGAMIVNSQFMENIAKNEGGAMFLHGGGTIVNANFTKTMQDPVELLFLEDIFFLKVMYL